MIELEDMEDIKSYKDDGERKKMRMKDFFDQELWNISQNYAEEDISWKNTYRLRVFFKTPLELEKVDIKDS